LPVKTRIPDKTNSFILIAYHLKNRIISLGIDLVVVKAHQPG
jgi:hypothetical protein